jgi:hypothetical protein
LLFVTHSCTAGVALEVRHTEERVPIASTHVIHHILTTFFSANASCTAEVESLLPYMSACMHHKATLNSMCYSAEFNFTK